jgi:hypothetical protein
MAVGFVDAGRLNAEKMISERHRSVAILIGGSRGLCVLVCVYFLCAAVRKQ